jgi:hypothetical protein
MILHRGTTPFMVSATKVDAPSLPMARLEFATQIAATKLSTPAMMCVEQLGHDRRG